MQCQVLPAVALVLLALLGITGVVVWARGARRGDDFQRLTGQLMRTGMYSPWYARRLARRFWVMTGGLALQAGGGLAAYTVLVRTGSGARYTLPFQISVSICFFGTLLIFIGFLVPFLDRRSAKPPRHNMALPTATRAERRRATSAE